MVFALVSLGKSFLLRFSIAQDQRRLVLSTSYNDVFGISCMRFYNVAQLQFMVELQRGEFLIWGPLLSLKMG